MGSSLQAICPCGYEEFFDVGGGFEDRGSLCLAPVLDEAAARVRTRNYWGRQVRNGKSGSMTFYDQPTLRDPKAAWDAVEVIFAWSGWDEHPDFVLMDGQFLCPRCRAFDMRFKDAGMMWD